VDMNTITSLFNPNSRATNLFLELEHMWWLQDCMMGIDCEKFLSSYTFQAFMGPQDLEKDLDTLMMLSDAVDHGITLGIDQMRQPSYFLDVHYYTCCK